MGDMRSNSPDLVMLVGGIFGESERSLRESGKEISGLGAYDVMKRHLI